MMPGLQLRDVSARDLPVFFEQQSDAAAVRLAAFTPEDPEDPDAFTARWDRILNDENTVNRTIVFEERVVGHIAKFDLLGKPQVTYWIGREHWGKGLATAALSAFLSEYEARPLYASAAKDNVASLRVLEKCGFILTGHERAYANARGQEIEEAMLELR